MVSHAAACSLPSQDYLQGAPMDSTDHQIHFRFAYSSIMMSYSWNNTFVFFKRLATSDKCINPGRHNITSSTPHVVYVALCWVHLSDARVLCPRFV